MKLLFRTYDCGDRIGVSMYIGPRRGKPIRLGRISELSVRRKVAAVMHLKGWALSEVKRSPFLKRARNSPRHETP